MPCGGRLRLLVLARSHRLASRGLFTTAAAAAAATAATKRPRQAARALAAPLHLRPLHGKRAASSHAQGHGPANAHHDHHHAEPPVPLFDWEALLAEKKVWNREDPELVKDLRSDHAGETGAVFIYVGAVAAMRLGPPERFSEGARAFVDAHQRTEQQHLAFFDRLLEPSQRSKLLPLWRASGFLLGYVPTVLGGERALFCTVEAVESFVEVHYNQHIIPLASRPSGPYQYPELLRLLRHCCADEVHHMEDARDRWLAPGQERPLWARMWAAVVGRGSAAAVAVCRNI